MKVVRVEGKLNPRDTMRLYGIVLGGLFLSFLLGLYLGKNNFGEAPIKTVSHSIADTLWKNIRSELDFFALMGPSVAESQPPASKGELSADLKRPGKSPTDPNPSATPLFDVYTVQVGAFSDQAESLEAMNRLEIRGYASVLRTPSSSDSNYGVSVGRFETNQEALVMKETLNKDGFPTYIKIIQVSNEPH
jgi:hypothetical protein